MRCIIIKYSHVSLQNEQPQIIQSFELECGVDSREIGFFIGEQQIFRKQMSISNLLKMVCSTAPNVFIDE